MRDSGLNKIVDLTWMMLITIFVGVLAHGEGTVTVSREAVVKAFAKEMSLSSTAALGIDRARQKAFVEDMSAQVPAIAERVLDPSYTFDNAELRDQLFAKVFHQPYVIALRDQELCLMQIEMALCRVDIAFVNASRVYWPSSEEKRQLEANIDQAMVRIRELIQKYGQGRFPQDVVDAQFKEDKKRALENMLDPTDDKFKRPINKKRMISYFDYLDLIAKDAIVTELQYERKALRERFAKGELPPKKIDKWDVGSINNQLLLNALGSLTWVDLQTRVSLKDRHPHYKALQGRIRLREKQCRENLNRKVDGTDEDSIVL